MAAASDGMVRATSMRSTSGPWSSLLASVIPGACQAIGRFAQARTLLPGQPEVVINLSIAYMTLGDFTADTYRMIAGHPEPLPAAFGPVFERMRGQDWLASYKKAGGDGFLFNSEAGQDVDPIK